MSADPNWLLSTTAQSAAALVAIVGGFLVSRVVTMSTERLGLERRLRSLTDDFERAMDGYNRAIDRRRRRDLDEWRDAIFDTVVEREGKIDIVTLVDQFGGNDRNVDELEPVLADLVDRVQRAYREIRMTLADIPSADDLDDVPQVRFIEDDREIYEQVFQRVKKERAPLPRFPEFTPYLGGIMPRLRPPTLVLDLEGDELRAAVEVERITTEISATSGELARVARPEGVVPGIIVLVVLTVVGVVYPIVLMSFGWPRLTIPWRISVLAGLVGGLLALVGYLVWAVARLRRVGDGSGAQGR